MVAGTVDCPLGVDGEVLGATPLEVELQPGAIRVVVDTDRSRAVCTALISKNGNPEKVESAFL